MHILTGYGQFSLNMIFLSVDTDLKYVPLTKLKTTNLFNDDKTDATRSRIEFGGRAKL